MCIVVLPGAISIALSRGDPAVRVWIMGCSSGEEVTYLREAIRVRVRVTVTVTVTVTVRVRVRVKVRWRRTCVNALTFSRCKLGM